MNGIMDSIFNTLWHCIFFVPPCHIFTDNSVSVSLGNHKAKKPPNSVPECLPVRVHIHPHIALIKIQLFTLSTSHQIRHNPCCGCINGGTAAPLPGKGNCHSALMQTTTMLLQSLTPFLSHVPNPASTDDCSLAFIKSILVTG